MAVIMLLNSIHQRFQKQQVFKKFLIISLDQDDTYAFGDGENDLEMIEFCRVGVAMGNACDLLKAKANIICKSVVDDGLEDILKILFSD